MHRFGGHLSRGAELGAEAAAVPGGDRGDARSSEGGSEGEPSEQQNAGRSFDRKSAPTVIAGDNRLPSRRQAQPQAPGDPVTVSCIARKYARWPDKYKTVWRSPEHARSPRGALSTAAQRPATAHCGPDNQRLLETAGSSPSLGLELVGVPHVGIEQVREQLRASQRARQRQVPDGRLFQVVDKLV